MNAGFEMLAKAQTSALSGEHSTNSESEPSAMSNSGAMEQDQASVHPETDKVQLDFRLASTESESHHDTLLPATQMLPLEPASSVDGHASSKQLTGHVVHDNQQPGKGEAPSLAESMSPDTHSQEFVVNEGTAEPNGQVKTPVSMSDSVLLDTQHEHRHICPLNGFSLNHGTNTTINYQSSFDAILLDTQCGSTVLEETREEFNRAINSEITKLLPSEMPLFITGHFKASKSFMPIKKSLLEEISQDLRPLTKQHLDDELPDTQPPSPTWPQRPEETLNYLPSLSSPSNDQGTYAGPQARSFFQHSTLAIERLPDSQPQKQIDISNLENEENELSVYPEYSQLSVITSGDIKAPMNRVSCKERKRITVSSNRPPRVTKAMVDWVSHTNWLLDPFREDDDCWFHPSPPSARLSVSGVLRPVGKLQKRFAWKDNDGKHSVVLNYGIVVKLVYLQMTKQQKDGFIDKQWHLSHLCGNWTCLNPTHTTIEPGTINISRNSCFSHRSGCLHTPKCLKDKKVALGSDGKLIDHSERAAENNPGNSQVDDYSSPLLLDDDDDTIMEDFEASDSELPDNTGLSSFPSDIPSGEDDREVLYPRAMEAKHILPI